MTSLDEAGQRAARRSRQPGGRRFDAGLARRVLAWTRPYRPTLALFVVLVVVDAAVVTAYPLVLRALIDRGISGGDERLVVVSAIGLAGLAVADQVLGITQRFLSARVGEHLVFDLRAAVFRHLQRLPIAFFQRTQTGSLVSRLNADVLGAQRAFTDLLSDVVGNLVLVVSVLVVLAALSWPLAVAAVVLLPLALVPVQLISRRVAGLTRTRMNANARLAATMTEQFSVAGAQLHRLYGDPATEAERFEDQAGRVRDLGIRLSLYGRVFFVGIAVVAALAGALAYGWGGVLAVRGELAIGTVVAIVALLGRLYGPLSSLAGAHVDVATTLVSFERVFEVLDLDPPVKERPDAVALPRGPATVAFERVDFTYPRPASVSLASLEPDDDHHHPTGRRVLHDVTFTIEPGQLVALVGPSGAGKTTISALVPRLYDVDAGAVRIDGHDVRDLASATLRQRIGVVTQDPHLLHDTVRANLLLARPGATDDDQRDALARAQVLEVIDGLPAGLDTVVGERGYRLSGGEKQRVAIARLLLKGPDIVVLDEATAHLDTESEAAVHRALDTALAGRTALVIAHRLSTVQRADRILVIDGGRIVEQGTHDELRRLGGLYDALHRVQFRDAETPAVPPSAGDAQHDVLPNAGKRRSEIGTGER